MERRGTSRMGPWPLPGAGPASYRARQRAERAAPGHFTLSPGPVVHAGTTLTVTDASGCTGAADAYVKAPQGEGAVAYGSASGPGWVVHLALPPSVPPGTYVVGADCAGVAYTTVRLTILAPGPATAVPGSATFTG